MPAEYRLIENDDDLQNFCHHLNKVDTIYIDTEFVGEKYYYPRLEIIQIYDGKKRLGLIDIHSVKKTDCLAKILADESKLKVFHSPQQDILILQQYFGSVPKPIFDTQLAAAMLGIGSQVSFAALVKMFAHVDLPKSHTVSDWSHRPLSKSQLDYAADDVYFLPTIYSKLMEQLEKKERLDWLNEEQELRIEETINSMANDSENAFRSIKEWNKLSGVRLAALQGLALWRESVAESTNTPKRLVMSDSGLISIARSLPKSTQDAKKVRQVPQGPLHRHMDEILDTVQQALKLPKDQWPKKPRGQKPDIPVGFLELLQALLRTIAEDEKIAPSLLAKSSDLQQLINNRHDIKLEKNPLLQGWRRELAGDKILAFLEGRLRLKIDGKETIRFY